MSTPLFILLLLAAALWVLVELLSLLGLASWIPSASRSIYHKTCGHIVVKTPDDLNVAAANGVVRKGDAVVVGHAHEGNGETIRRFAIPPSVAGRPIGTLLRIVSITRKSLVLMEVPMERSGDIRT